MHANIVIVRMIWFPQVDNEQTNEMQTISSQIFQTEQRNQYINIQIDVLCIFTLWARK